MSSVAQQAAPLSERGATQEVRKWLTGVRRLRARSRRVAMAPPGSRCRALPPSAALGRPAGVLGRARPAPAAGWITFKEAFGGFLLGCALAFVLALALARWRPFGDALMPYMIAANAIPIIAFAPITNAWFGTLSPWSKIAISAVLCYFPVLVNTLRGLTSVGRSRSSSCVLRGTPTNVFRRVRIPNTLPFVFSALKVASVLAMIGAVVGDYFGGSTEALGVEIVSAVALSQYEMAWAAILVASILGIVFYARRSRWRCGSL